jgi:peptidoglycan/LPS O-acetylase OafA/YrhL
MKTQRILGILWLVLFTFTIGLWLWKFRPNPDMESGLAFHPLGVLLSLFGAIASYYLIRGAQWARFAIGIVALALVALVISFMWKLGRWNEVDECFGIFALVSAAILLFPSRHAVAS